MFFEFYVFGISVANDCIELDSMNHIYFHKPFDRWIFRNKEA